MRRFLAAAVQNSSSTQWTASVMLYGTDLANFILLLTTTLPFLKLRISRFLKPVRFAWRNGSSCTQKQRRSHRLLMRPCGSLNVPQREDI